MRTFHDVQEGKHKAFAAGPSTKTHPHIGPRQHFIFMVEGREALKISDQPYIDDSVFSFGGNFATNADGASKAPAQMIFPSEDYGFRELFPVKGNQL